ncbi:hypothetical protein NG2371_02670 [Nocardia gamkensis]|nr:hypothetical protein [Nocardia gamkensis]
MQSITSRRARDPRLYGVRTGDHTVPYGIFGPSTWQNLGRGNPGPPTGPAHSSGRPKLDFSWDFTAVIFS